MKQYNQPKMEMILLDAQEDVITTSSPTKKLRLVESGSGETWNVFSSVNG